jgi:hypothetical protein
MKKIICVLLAVILMTVCAACNDPSEKDPDTEEFEFSGDYSYQPQRVVMPIAHYGTDFVIKDFSVLKTFYASAGQGESAFLDLENKEEMMSPIEHIDSDSSIKRRDYFLMLFDSVRDQCILVPKKEDSQISLDYVYATPPDFDFLSIHYNFSPGVIRGVAEPFTAMYSTRLSVPSSLQKVVKPTTVIGEGYRVDFYDTQEYYDLYPSMNASLKYEGYVYTDDAAAPIMVIELYYNNSGDAASLKAALPLFSELRVMTIYEAMLAAPTLESE